MNINLTMMIGCIKREIAMREQVYPSLVVRGRMKQGLADYEILCMRTVLETLEELQKQREKGT